MNSTKVVVIGAGLAGLTCARDLLKFNSQLDVTILEASNRIGGRVHSMTADDGTKLELGAHYIHGTIGNPIYDYAIRKGVIKKKSNENRPYEVKHWFHKDLKTTCTEEILTTAYREGFAYKRQLFDIIDSQINNTDLEHYTSLGEYVVPKYENYLEKYNDNIPYLNALKSVFACTLHDEAISNGCPSVYDLDLRGFVSFVDIEGDQYRMSDDTASYSDIVQAIRDEIEKDCIQLNHVVNKIERHANGKFIVACKNGSSFYCDFVVCTVSLGVLKSFIAQDIFKIKLPSKKLSSIQKLQIGQIMKVYIKFKKPFPTDVRYIRLYPSVDNFQREHLNKVQSIHTCQRISQSDWWLIWLNADWTIDYENYTPEIFLQKLSTAMKEHYPDFDNEIDTSVHHAFSWTTDAHYQGSYSYLPNRSKTDDIMELQTPVMCNTRGGILFAGEMTQPSCYGTTHAAYTSGTREAQRMIDLLKK